VGEWVDYQSFGDALFRRIGWHSKASAKCLVGTYLMVGHNHSATDGAAKAVNVIMLSPLVGVVNVYVSATQKNLNFGGAE
jgi:multidrug resistance efflux pump